MTTELSHQLSIGFLYQFLLILSRAQLLYILLYRLLHRLQNKIFIEWFLFRVFFWTPCSRLVVARYYSSHLWRPRSSMHPLLQWPKAIFPYFCPILLNSPSEYVLWIHIKGAASCISWKIHPERVEGTRMPPTYLPRTIGHLFAWS